MRQACLIGLLLLPLVLPAASPSRGSILVASPGSTDPDFAMTVVLLLRTDAQGAIGLILNQPSPVPVSTLFPRLPLHAKRMPVYKGGPLRMGINALIREKRPGPGQSLVFGDVYLASEKTDIETLLSRSPPGLPLRVYVGLCGWTAGQLAGELQRGIWSLHVANAGAIFDSSPGTLWSRLTR